MRPVSLAPLSGRYLSFAEREEITILKAKSCGVREIARQMHRSPSTISRELRRNAATRAGLGSAEQTRTPTDCYVSISRREPSSPVIPVKTWTPTRSRRHKAPQDPRLEEAIRSPRRSSKLCLTDACCDDSVSLNNIYQFATPSASMRTRSSPRLIAGRQL